MDARIRSARRRAGWSQQELADRSGLSRSLVAAVEAGRQQPSVAAALALGRTLGCSVEELFGPEAEPATPVLGSASERGSAVLTVRVGHRLVSESTAHQVAAPERWVAGDAVVGEDGALTWLPGGRTDGIVLAGCDPALGLLAELVGRASHHRVVTVHASTGRALDALAAGAVHGVLVHAASGGLPPSPVPVRRWHVASWAVGLASAAAATPTVEELAERGSTVAQRDPGAGSQLALVRALQRAGVDQALAGPTGDGHLDVARRVRSGQVDAGVTMEAAARTLDLGFRSLEVHDAQLWIDERYASLPEVAVLGSVLCEAAFARQAEVLPGYDVAGCGRERTAS